MKYIDYSENKKHGNFDFPIQYYYVNNKHERYVMPLHWHIEIEFIRVKSGTIELFLNNISYTISANEQIIIPGGTLHRGVPKDCIYECIVFNPDMLCKHKNDVAEKYIMPIINHTVNIVPLTSGKPETYNSVNKLFDEFNKSKNGNELNIYSILYKVFSSLYKEKMIFKSQITGKAEGQNLTVSRILDWAQDNFSKNITLSDMANVSNLSENYLCRLFKNYTCMTPIEYINNLRIENACHLMIHSDLSVTESAFESGFNDLSYFSKLFKRYKGVTPSAYKKSLIIS